MEQFDAQREAMQKDLAKERDAMEKGMHVNKLRCNNVVFLKIVGVFNLILPVIEFCRAELVTMYFVIPCCLKLHILIVHCLCHTTIGYFLHFIYVFVS